MISRFFVLLGAYLIRFEVVFLPIDQRKNISLFLLCIEPWHILCINIRFLYSITIELSYHHNIFPQYVSPIIFPPIYFPPLSLLHYLPSSSIFLLFYVIPIIFNIYEPYYISPLSFITTSSPLLFPSHYICPLSFHIHYLIPIFAPFSFPPLSSLQYNYPTNFPPQYPTDPFYFPITIPHYISLITIPHYSPHIISVALYFPHYLCTLTKAEDIT